MGGGRRCKGSEVKGRLGSWVGPVLSVILRTLAFALSEMEPLQSGSRGRDLIRLMLRGRAPYWSELAIRPPARAELLIPTREVRG